MTKMTWAEQIITHEPPSNGEKVDTISATIQDLVDALRFLPNDQMNDMARSDRDQLVTLLLRAGVTAGNLSASIRDKL